MIVAILECRGDVPATLQTLLAEDFTTMEKSSRVMLTYTNTHTHNEDLLHLIGNMCYQTVCIWCHSILLVNVHPLRERITDNICQAEAARSKVEQKRRSLKASTNTKSLIRAAIPDVNEGVTHCTKKVVSGNLPFFGCLHQ